MKRISGKFARMALAFLCVFCCCASIVGCDNRQQSEYIRETRLLLGTYCTITIYSGGNTSTEEVGDTALLEEAFGMCERLEALFSMTVENSDVWRVNHAKGEPVAVDAQTIEVVTRGLEFGELSGGMFDITVGRLSRLWDFGGEPSVPSESELKEAQMTVYFRQISMDGNSLQLRNTGAWLDLGGIAKGYIADKMAEFLRDNGVHSALIELGGDVVAVGAKHDGTPWRIGVRKPFGDRDEYIDVLNVSGYAVVSSGTYERQFEENGISYHHILNPFTGMPVKSDLISATVIAESALTGEGLSTVAILVGSERAQAMFSQTTGFIGAVLVLENGEALTFGDVGEFGIKN